MLPRETKCPRCGAEYKTNSAGTILPHEDGTKMVCVASGMKRYEIEAAIRAEREKIAWMYG